MRGLAGIVLLLALVTACGVRPTGIVEAGGAPQADAANTTNPIYFVKDGKLTAVQRVGVPTEPLLAIQQLAEGPTLAERRRGLTSEVMKISVTFSDAKPQELLDVVMYTSADPSEWPRLAKAQIACTAAAIPGVEFVALSATRVKGSFPASCDQFQDLMR